MFSIMFIIFATSNNNSDLGILRPYMKKNIFPSNEKLCEIWNLSVITI